MRLLCQEAAAAGGAPKDFTGSAITETCSRLSAIRRHKWQQNTFFLDFTHEGGGNGVGHVAANV